MNVLTVHALLTQSLRTPRRKLPIRADAAGLLQLGRGPRTLQDGRDHGGRRRGVFRRRLTLVWAHLGRRRSEDTCHRFDHSQFTERNERRRYSLDKVTEARMKQKDNRKLGREGTSEYSDPLSAT